MYDAKSAGMTSLPIAAPIALFMYGLQMRIDGWKITKSMGRPFPWSVQDQADWIWFHLIENFMHIAAATNIALVSFVMEPMSSTSLHFQGMMFFGLFSAYCVIFVIIAPDLYPAKSSAILLTEERHTYQRNKASHKLAGYMGNASEVSMKMQAKSNLDLKSISTLNKQSAKGFQGADDWIQSISGRNAFGF